MEQQEANNIISGHKLLKESTSETNGSALRIIFAHC